MGVKIFCSRTTVSGKKINVYAATVEQAKPLPKIMNQHNQRGMQSTKLKDIGKDLENSSSKNYCVTVCDILRKISNMV